MHAEETTMLEPELQLEPADSLGQHPVVRLGQHPPEDWVQGSNLELCS
jgi:hypothetical protein